VPLFEAILVAVLCEHTPFAREDCGEVIVGCPVEVQDTPQGADADGRRRPTAAARYRWSSRSSLPFR
jgi:hypothetical protein